MRKSYYNVNLLTIFSGENWYFYSLNIYTFNLYFRFLFVLAFWLIGHTQANFDMLISKKYDHYFLELYHTAFTNHLNDVSKNQNLELDLENYAKEKKSRGFVKEWDKFGSWNSHYFKHLRQHFLFAVRVAKESTDSFQLLVFIYVKYQAYLRAITYLNGAIIFSEKDERKIFCRVIAVHLMNFSDVGTNDIFEKLHATVQVTYGSVFTNKIIRTLRMWATAAYVIWVKFEPQIKSNNSSQNLGQLYQKLCNDENEIMTEARLGMMSLFEGIKQGAVEPSFPSEERLTLNFAAALSLWDMSYTMWVDHFKTSIDKFHLKEMMIQYDKIEMRLYGELYEANKEPVNFDDLKDFNSLVFDETTGKIELAKIKKETDTIGHKNVNKEELSREGKDKKVKEE